MKSSVGRDIFKTRSKCEDQTTRILQITEAAQIYYSGTICQKRFNDVNKKCGFVTHLTLQRHTRCGGVLSHIPKLDSKSQWHTRG